MNNFEQRPTVNAEVGLNAFLTKMFGWMTLAVIVSAITAYGMSFAHIQLSGLGIWVPLIVWFVLPFFVNAQAMKRPGLAFVLLMVYAVVTGGVFSIYALIYSGTAITSAFLSSAILFITMAVMGLTTKRDLSKLGNQASAALIALVIVMLINLFLRNSLISLVFSVIAVIIFTILTATDTQRLRNLYLQYGNEETTTGLAVSGALQLYLDFVNLFLQLLQIFGIFGNDRN